MNEEEAKHSPAEPLSAESQAITCEHNFLCKKCGKKTGTTQQYKVEDHPVQRAKLTQGQPKKIKTENFN